MSKTPQEQTGTASQDPDRPAALLEFQVTGQVKLCRSAWTALCTAWKSLVACAYG